MFNLDGTEAEAPEGNKSLQSTSTAASGLNVNQGNGGGISETVVLVVVVGGAIIVVAGFLGLVLLSKKG